mgnify:CR=1 FL=1
MADNEEGKDIKKFDPVNVFGITFFLTIGSVFVLNIFNILPWGVWSIILRFWSIFLVLLLIQFFGKKYKVAYSIVASLGIGLIIAILFFSVSSVSSRVKMFSDLISPQVRSISVLFGLDLGQRLTSKFEFLSSDFPEVSERKINIVIPTGEFFLTDNLDASHFSAKVNYYEKFGKPKVITRLRDKTLLMDFEAEKSLKPLFGGAEDVKYDISIGNPQVPYDLVLDIGAALFNAKFTNPNVNTFKIKVGVGSGNVFIGDDALPKKNIEIDVAAGSLNLRLPSRTFARIKYEIEVGTLIINENSFNKSGVYTTPNFRIESDPFEITVKLGAGSVVIDSTGSESF